MWMVLVSVGHPWPLQCSVQEPFCSSSEQLDGTQVSGDKRITEHEKPELKTTEEN